MGRLKTFHLQTSPHTSTTDYEVGRDQYLQYQQLKLRIKEKVNLSSNTLQPSQLVEELKESTIQKKKNNTLIYLHLYLTFT